MSKFSISWKIVENDLSIYFDRNIPQWIKTKKALQKECKKRFIEAMKVAIRKQIKEEEDLILYGNPDSSDEPIGILNAKIEK